MSLYVSCCTRTRVHSTQLGVLVLVVILTYIFCTHSYMYTHEKVLDYKYVSELMKEYPYNYNYRVGVLVLKYIFL